jgi:hypothetical protein
MAACRDTHNCTTRTQPLVEVIALSECVSLDALVAMGVQRGCVKFLKTHGNEPCVFIVFGTTSWTPTLGGHCSIPGAPTSLQKELCV